MAGTLAWTAGNRGAASSVNFDSTGGDITLPADTQQVELYCEEASFYKLSASAGAEEWLPIPADTWVIIRELDGRPTLAIKAVSTAGKVYAQAISPAGTRTGR